MHKKIIKLVLIILILNGIAIFFNVKDGIRHGDMMLRFHEKEAITFLSALLLGLTSLISFILYLLKRKVPSPDYGFRFWLFSAIGFFYLCMDEYFMAHEGIDNWVGSWFGKDIEHLNLDNLVLAAFGLAALAVCFWFRRELIRHKEMIPFLFLGAGCLLGTIVFHSLERIDIVYEVIEESFKIVGVSFFFGGYLSGLLLFIKGLSISAAHDSSKSI